MNTYRMLALSAFLAMCTVFSAYAHEMVTIGGGFKPAQA